MIIIAVRHSKFINSFNLFKISFLIAFTLFRYYLILIFNRNIYIYLYCIVLYCIICIYDYVLEQQSIVYTVNSKLPFFFFHSNLYNCFILFYLILLNFKCACRNFARAAHYAGWFLIGRLIKAGKHSRHEVTQRATLFISMIHDISQDYIIFFHRVKNRNFR